MAKKNLGFEKKSGTPVFFCEQEVFFERKKLFGKNYSNAARLELGFAQIAIER